MWGIEAAKSLTDLQRVLSNSIKRLLDRADATDAAIESLSSLQVQINSLRPVIKQATSNYTVLASDDIIICSGATFAITLPTAVGVKGKQYTIIHNGANLTQSYSIATTGGQTVGGIVSGSYILYTNQETLKIVSDDSNWVILEHFAETPWIDSGAIVITATITNPTKATGPVRDKLFWKRIGSNVHIDLQYKAPNSTTGAANGSGGYLFNMPNGITFDTAITGANTSGVIGDFDRSYGTVMLSDGSAIRPGAALVYSTTQIHLWGYSTVSNSMVRVGSADFNMATTRRLYGANLILPVSGWQP